MFCAYSLVLDDKRGLSAFTESFAVVRGHWWPVLGRLLWLMLWYMIATLIIVGIEFVIRLVFGYGIQSFANGLVTGLLNMLLTLVFVPFSMTYFYKMYVELRAMRSAGDTKTFKGWLIAFMVIGILLPIIGVLSASTLASLNRARLDSLQQQMNSQFVQSSTSTPVQSNGNLVK